MCLRCPEKDGSGDDRRRYVPDHDGGSPVQLNRSRKFNVLQTSLGARQPRHYPHSVDGFNTSVKLVFVAAECCGPSVGEPSPFGSIEHLGRLAVCMPQERATLCTSGKRPRQATNTAAGARLKITDWNSLMKVATPAAPYQSPQGLALAVQCLALAPPPHRTSWSFARVQKLYFHPWVSRTLRFQLAMAFWRARRSREASLTCAAERDLALTASLQVLSCAGAAAVASHAERLSPTNPAIIRKATSPSNCYCGVSIQVPSVTLAMSARLVAIAMYSPFAQRLANER
jgi:hypothetical protein